MKVVILSVSSAPANTTIVEVSAATMSFAGVWSSHARTPIAGTGYTVELDLDGELNAFLGLVSRGDTSSLVELPETNVMFGVVDSIDSDGVVYIRFAADCLVMVEKGTTDVVAGDTLTLAVPRKQLRISPVGG